MFEVILLDKLKNFLFGEQSLRQTLFKNSFWLGVSNIASHLIKLVIVIYAARLLGAAEYGLFSYAIGVAATFTILSDSGLNYLITINMARREKNHEGYFSTLMLLRVSLVLAVVALTVAVGPLITRFSQAKILIPMVAFLLAFDDFRGLLNSISRAENRMDKEAFGYIITNVLIVALAVIGLKYSPTSYMLTLMYLLGSALGTLTVFITVKEDVNTIFRPLRFNPTLVKGILAVAIPFGLANAMWTLMVNTDTVIIGWLRTTAELGYYAAAQRPVMAFALIPTVMAGSSFALIARLAKEGTQERLKNFIERLITLSLAIVLPLAVGGAIIAPAIIHFLYGQEYVPAILSFQLLLATLVIIYPSSIVTNLVLAFKQQKIFTLAMIAGALGNLALDLLLIPLFGIAGSVVATIGALSIINGYMWHQAKKIQLFVIIPFLPRILFATALMSLVTFILHLAATNFFVNIIISGAVYLGILIVTREPLLGDFKGLIRFQN